MEKKEEQQHFDEQQQIYATSVIDELAIELGKIEISVELITQFYFIAADDFE